MTANQLVGERVLLQLRRHGRTQTEAAAFLGISQSTLSKKMNDDRPFSIEEVLSLAAWLDIPITDLMPTATIVDPVDPSTGEIVEPPGRVELPPIHYECNDYGDSTPSEPYYVPALVSV